MYEVLCERCWYTEALDGDEKPDYSCPKCGTDAWLGPFAEAPQRFSRKDSWPVLTSQTLKVLAHDPQQSALLTIMSMATAKLTGTNIGPLSA